MNPTIKPMVGKEFDRYTVLDEPPERSNSGKLKWWCRCKCGTRRLVDGEGLRSGHSKSCGCLKKEKLSARMKTQAKTHGMTGTPTYVVWVTMKARCYRADHDAYPWYGGRGIGVCERWRNSFHAFLEDMGERPSKQLTLDRKNGDLDYSPENCRWATMKEQNRNRSDNRIIEWRGRKQTISGWAEELGFDVRMLWNRLFRYGWDIERAMTEPSGLYHNKVKR